MSEDPFKNQEQLALKTEEATVADWKDYKEISIEAAETDPDAFHLDLEKVEKKKNRKDNEWQEDLLDENRFTVLSRYNSRPVGMAWARNVEQGIWAVRGVFVSLDIRKSVTGDGAVAHEIMQKVLDGIKKRGGTLARLWVLIERKNSIALYEKFNFKKVPPEVANKIAGPDSHLLSEWQIMVADLKKSKDTS